MPDGQTECLVSAPRHPPIEVSAPGFASVQRSVRVRDTMGECGCLIVETQRVDVVLVKGP
jgi:hypothetical protein